ncbi:MAG: DHA1 family bicyclomycin/chloramphenicol resistance-like MFS transporter [Psychromonas sp.]|uniref:multidrug effflux MFS transporter n=1 Tax=Psychromonas sp. TaxID=1884585 RepID=UPI0039E36BA7
MKKEQPFLGKRGTLLFLVLISAFPPLTTDIYLPAMPHMVDTFATTQSMVNLTLTVYFITYAAGLLFWGPLSEKFGRKPILLTGLGIYIICSILCAFSMNIEFLIFSRMLQAFGGSAVTVVATAIVKDLYDGREREKIMATVMSLVIIAPMIAPVLGAFLLKVSSWQMIFVVLAIFGGISSIFACLYQETLEQKYSGSMLRSWGRLAVVLKNPNFVTLLVIFSMASMSIMSFLAVASYIYIDGFGLTEQEFSFIFAFNALFAIIGPTLYIRISNYVSTQNIVSCCFALMMCCGLIIFAFGHLSPWLFAFTVAPATVTVIIMRVPGANLMLEQQQGDTGSAAALIQFFGMIMGAVGMILVSLDPDSLIKNLGTIQAVVGFSGGFLWFIVRDRPFVTDNVAQIP